MFFNINNYVRVRLTQHGRELHRADYESLMRHFPKGSGPFPYTPPKEDEKGWSRWQMWDLMKTFGEHCYNGCTLPFETEIEIEEK